MRLNDSRAKLRRAQEHFDALKLDIQTFLEPKPYRVVIENPADDLYIARLDNAPDIPGEDWALRIGDCIHNLRAALDYIAWRLAGSRPTDKQTQFPIFNTKPGWDNNHVHADKHKLLTVVAAMPLQFSLVWSSPIDDPTKIPRVNVLRNTVLRGDAILATLVIPNSPPNLQMKNYLAPDIAFSEGLIESRIPVRVVPSLSNMLVEVAAIIDTFESRPELFPG